MTPFKFDETFDYKGYITALWQLNIETYIQYSWKRDTDDDLHKSDPDKCCNIYKVEPMKQAIEELKIKAWISGLRATEGETRKELPTFQKDQGLIKINPILDWTEADVWRYHAFNFIPPHPLYLQGYRSLGCEPCSTKGGKYERDGRWKGTCKQGGECGIHTYGLKSGKKII